METMLSLAVVQFLPLIFLSIFAIWKENHVLFMLTAGVAIMTGLYSPDIISGNTETTSLGITIGLCLIAYGFVCWGWAFRLIFWRE